MHHTVLALRVSIMQSLSAARALVCGSKGTKRTCGSALDRLLSETRHTRADPPIDDADGAHRDADPALGNHPLCFRQRPTIMTSVDVLPSTQPKSAPRAKMTGKLSLQSTVELSSGTKVGGSARLGRVRPLSVTATRRGDTWPLGRRWRPGRGASFGCS